RKSPPIKVHIPADSWRSIYKAPMGEPPMRVSRPKVLVFTILLSAIVPTSRIAAQSNGTGVALSYIPGTTLKLEQVIGDCDWQFLDYSSQKGTCKPTASRTVTRFNVLGNGQGGSFEVNGKMMFLFGDTISGSGVNFGGHD